MDPINAEKLQAIKNRKSRLLNKLFLHSATVLFCALFCSHPLWFPRLISSLKHLVFVSLPNLKSLFFSPKYLFIVGNVIVIFLFGQSKLSSSSSSPVGEIYEEYVERSRGVREGSINLEKKEWKREVNLSEESVLEIEDKHMIERREETQSDDDDGHEEDEGEDEDHDIDDDDHDREGEEPGLPAEELNKKFEDFIARVNRQMWLEARLEEFGRG